jgi:site-specific DNA-adenine methylase
MQFIKNANCQFAFCSYENYKITDYTNTIFYCDPPYRNTIGYKGSKEKFDHNKFYDWCIEMSKNNLVIISEYNMPTDFEVIFEKNKPNSLQAQMGKTDVMVEKIFIHPNSLEWIVSQ